MTKIPAELNEWAKLSQLIREAELRQETQMRSTHERFNVFTTVLSIGDEVRLHTRFIGKLLDPEGEHDCGSLFLDLFFETLNKCSPKTHGNEDDAFNAINFKGNGWRLRKEKRTEQGQLDLLLESPHCVLVIENKIFHHEGERQIARYAEYLESRKQEADLKKVLFLTPTGHEASTHEGREGVPFNRCKSVIRQAVFVEVGPQGCPA